MRLPAAVLQARLFAHLPGDIEDCGRDGCTVRLSAGSAELVVQYIGAIAALGAEFTLDAPVEITDRVRILGCRLTA